MTLEKFMNRVEKHQTGCWHWLGYCNAKGYGRISVRFDKRTYAHRLSWEFHNGTVPDDLCVLHRCDNPGCVNPAHLFLGTIADNTADMMSKGRNGYTGNPGEKHPACKLTEKDVRKIQDEYDLRGGQYGLLTELSRKYGVSPSQILNIGKRDSWKHL